MLRRLGFFFLTNLLVIVTISLVLNILGVGPYLTRTGIDYTALLAFCFVWGMTGALVSLAISRIAAKWMMGVKVIPPGSSGEFGWLVSTVHDLAHRAGLSVMPEVGIYDSPEINAFATGPTKSRSLVAVSTGILHHMGREELEGVLAHEVGHIKNGDMVTMTLIQGVVNAFVMFFARIVAFAISQGVRSEDRAWVNTLVTFLLEIVIGVFGIMVVAWFSRKREFRADRAGAQLAGTYKMSGALKSLESYLSARTAGGHESMEPFKISGRSSSFLHLFSTHPPLADRIARLEQYR